LKTKWKFEAHYSLAFMYFVFVTFRRDALIHTQVSPHFIYTFLIKKFIHFFIKKKRKKD